MTMGMTDNTQITKLLSSLVLYLDFQHSIAIVFDRHFYQYNLYSSSQYFTVKLVFSKTIMG